MRYHEISLCKRKTVTLERMQRECNTEEEITLYRNIIPLCAAGPDFIGLIVSKFYQYIIY